MSASVADHMAPPPGDAGMPRTRRGTWLRNGATLVLVPAVAAFLVLRFVIPSRLEGAAGGLTGFVAWLGDEHPLMVGVALFVAFSESARYWAGHLRPGVSSAAAGARPAPLTRRMVFALAGVAAAIVLVRGSVVATYRIVGPSMLPTMEIGDRVLVNRLAYGFAFPFSKKHFGARAPKRGDLVVFRAEGRTGADGPSSVVKRVIGVPGDDIAFAQGGLAINGWRVPSCDAGPYVHMDGRLTVRGRLTVEYLDDKTYLTVHKPVEQPFPSYVVRPGEVFVVGDDRGQSSDSRFWSEGRGAGVTTDMLQGRVSRVLFGARPDGRLDFSRILAPPLETRLRIAGLDMTKTDQRIANCLARKPAVTTPPPPQP